jgi:phospholipase A1
MKFLIVSFIFSLILSASTEYEDAYLIYKDGNYTGSFTLFKELAEQENDLDAAYMVASMYEKGEGCKADKNASIEWYERSAKGYFKRNQDYTDHHLDKERLKIYDTLNKSDDDVTNTTIKRYSQSMYNIKAHGTNYFLPASYRYNGEYAPTNGHNAKSIETEFQFSLKYDFGANILGLNEIYSAAYTQLSFWQLYEKSAYFRETNYNPELFVTIPTSLGGEKTFIKAIRLAFAHQSNGRGGKEERSWNYLSGSAYFQYKLLFTEIKLWHRLPDAKDYNPELIDYIGNGHIRFLLPYKEHITQLIIKGNLKDHGSVELNYSHPTLGREDLFVYIKLFSGYGESLIGYDEYINKMGIGFSISR